jgi:hypothetical protein
MLSGGRGGTSFFCEASNRQQHFRRRKMASLSRRVGLRVQFKLAFPSGSTIENLLLVPVGPTLESISDRNRRAQIETAKFLYSM